MALKDKILGGLFGQALGDAWGMPAYFDIDQTWQAFGGWIDTLVPAPDDHPMHYGLPAGRITDDSEVAFSLARAFIQHGGVTLEAAVEAIIAWYDRVDGDQLPYVGPSTRRGVQALMRGDDPHTTGLRGDTNGAPMRISPVGLMHPGDPAGAQGCMIITRDWWFQVPAFPVDQVVDTVGAGDTFDAAFVAGLINGLEMRECALLANEMGAASTRKVGAGTNAPTCAEMMAVLEQAGDKVDFTCSTP
jgi:hypothetical protein